MSGLFEHLAALDDTAQVQARVAGSVATKRIQDHYGAFLKNATTADDLTQRLALVEDGLSEVVSAVVAEYGGDPEKVLAAVKKAYTLPFAERTREASTREARRPKMCPYHSEVTDISLGAGDPQAGFNAMSNHAWGENHCKGGYAGSCNFRPAMVTQKYWDDKANEYAERARDRAQQDIPQPNIATDPIMDAEPLADEPGEGVTDINGELSEAPSAVADEQPMSLAASIKEAEALTTEKLPTGDKSALGEPSPKMDRRRWKPNALNPDGNVDPIKTEGEGSPHPTTHQDIKDQPDYKGDFLRDTDAVTETEDLPANSGDAGYSDGGQGHGPHTKTFGDSRNQANPVTRTTAVDPDKNPLAEIIESQYEGFLPSTTVQSALRDHEG